MTSSVSMPAAAVARDLLAAVDRVREVIAAGADEAEARGTLPPATIGALRQSGLLAMKVPAALGGSEADPLAQIDAIEALAYIDTCAAWCAMVGATAIAWPAAFLGDEALAEIFRHGNIPIAAVVVQPTGTATAVAGGYRLSGRWSFASGIRHADWIVAGAVTPSDSRGRAAKGLMLVVPAQSVTILDDWRSSGLQGTGSCGFTVDDLFVPTSFTWWFADAQPRRGGHLYRLGWPGFVVHEPAAFSLGVAARALDEFVAIERERESRTAQAIGRETAQHGIGLAQLRLRAARALVRDVFAEAWEGVCVGGPPSPRLQSEMRGAAAFATDVSIDVTTFAFRGGGSRAVYRASVLQRCLRDLQAAAQHWLVRETAYSIYGRCLVGVSACDPTADAR